MKGRNKKKFKPIEFEALTEPVTFPNKKFGQVNFCPVFVFGLLRARAKGSKLSNFSSYSKCRETMNRRPLPAAGIQLKIAGRDRNRYTPHPTRIGGTCTLLAAGLSANTVPTIADWGSNMVNLWGFTWSDLWGFITPSGLPHYTISPRRAAVPSRLGSVL